MHCFYKVFAQSHNDLNRIQNLSTKKIYYIGNLKLTNTMQINPRNKNIQLKTNKNKITVLLASTHENEEEKLLPLLKNLLNQFPNINLLIAPRHPERSQNILSLCEKFNLSAELESKKPINEKKIIIIDSFGILINYFKIADIVFLGGSLVSAGGHNPIEPANQECAILTGKQIFNWQNIYDDMVVENSCLKIDSLEDLEIALKDLINNKYKIEIMKQNAFNFAKKQFVDTNILDSIVNNHMNK
jgi:3-deoxy-D-manno-octulosonic-acid transferase